MLASNRKVSRSTPNLHVVHAAAVIMATVSWRRIESRRTKSVPASPAALAESPSAALPFPFQKITLDATEKHGATRATHPESL